MNEKDFAKDLNNELYSIERPDEHGVIKFFQRGGKQGLQHTNMEIPGLMTRPYFMVNSIEFVGDIHPQASIEFYVGSARYIATIGMALIKRDNRLVKALGTPFLLSYGNNFVVFVKGCYSKGEIGCFLGGVSYWHQVEPAT